MRIYLDNCCYNRPYDDQSQLPVSLETQAKLHIQDLIKNDKMELVTSYMLEYENSENPFEIRKNTIKQFMDSNESIYVSKTVYNEVIKKAEEIQATGVKYKDACHVACAILAKCDFFISTDRRLLKYETDEIKLINPIGFIEELEE